MSFYVICILQISRYDFYMGTATAKGGDMLTNKILRFFDDHVITALTFQKIHFSIYTLLLKKGTNLAQSFDFHCKKPSQFSSKTILNILHILIMTVNIICLIICIKKFETIKTVFKKIIFL